MLPLYKELARLVFFKVGSPLRMAGRDDSCSIHTGHKGISSSLTMKAAQCAKRML